MGVCSSRRQQPVLQRTGAQREIEINFGKLPQKLKEPEKASTGKQKSFTHLILQGEKSSNPQTFTQNLAPTEQLK